MLFIEYDVLEDGTVELVALIDAVEEDGADPDGEAYLAWRCSMEDEGHGSVRVGHDERAALEAISDSGDLRAAVEAIILADRRGKEASWNA